MSILCGDCISVNNRFRQVNDDFLEPPSSISLWVTAMKGTDIHCSLLRETVSPLIIRSAKWMTDFWNLHRRLPFGWQPWKVRLRHFCLDLAEAVSPLHLASGKWTGVRSNRHPRFPLCAMSIQFEYDNPEFFVWVNWHSFVCVMFPKSRVLHKPYESLLVLAGGESSHLQDWGHRFRTGPFAES